MRSIASRRILQHARTLAQGWNVLRQAQDEVRGRPWQLLYGVYLADALVDELGQGADRLRRHHSRAGVERQPRHLVLRAHHALHDRHEALHVEELVEGRADIAGLEAVDGRRGKVDAAEDDLAGFLAGLLQGLGHDARHAAVLQADRLQVRVGLDIGDKLWDAERGVAVDLLRDLQPVHLEAGLLKRIGEALFGYAALGLAENAPDHRLVAGFEALRQHRVGGERAAGVEVDAGVA